jgi:hypothetical protein
LRFVGGARWQVQHLNATNVVIGRLVPQERSQGSEKT